MTRKLLAVFGAIVLLGTMVVPAVARVNQPVPPASLVLRRGSDEPGRPDQGPPLFRAIPQLGQQPVDPAQRDRHDQPGRRAGVLDDSRRSTHRSPIRERRHDQHRHEHCRSGHCLRAHPGRTSRRDAHELPDIRPERSGVRSPVSGQHLQCVRVASDGQPTRCERVQHRLRQRTASRSRDGGRRCDVPSRGVSRRCGWRCPCLLRTGHPA